MNHTVLNIHYEILDGLTFHLGVELGSLARGTETLVNFLKTRQAVLRTVLYPFRQRDLCVWA